MEALEEKYRQFTNILSEEELGRLAEQYQTADQRERKLTIRIFFWLIVLSAGQGYPEKTITPEKDRPIWNRNRTVPIFTCCYASSHLSFDSHWLTPWHLWGAEPTPAPKRHFHSRAYAPEPQCVKFLDRIDVTGLR